ncbi:glycoside hydrolase family 16 protein [Winogradskyella vincentii]|uniref:Glycoside hydrolase family 16 protein n=1 Tax=Winogradskyella vincentii TaxID=2877122 RepID=A0ABS7Y2G5_9FLAO|nr:glycoside hydrolase family 16 protein [Winogradskyella vincentii]MCA0154133.1 glycoside hydrolase family 16 protein [Winogradskyella vincentii]
MKNRILNTKIKSGLIYSLLCVGIMVLITNCDPDETQTVAQFNNLSWHDEFEVDGAPNSAMWTYDIGIGDNGWGNNELQYYTSRPENVVVEDGMLKITAIQESFEGSGYTSARLLTKGLFEQQYGRFEARMKLPYGKGMWPAFWLLGSNIDEVSWPFCGEIDVMENGGSNPTIVSGAVHGPGYSGGNPIKKEYAFENSRADEFHIYGIEWGPSYINFYVDDVLYNQITPESLDAKDVDRSNWVFDNGPFYMLINLAVGGNFDGNPNADTVFPQTMYVDYVRVFSAN